MRIGKSLLDALRIFLAVLLWITGIGLAGGGLAWATLGRGDQALWYLVAACFITLGILLFRWHPFHAPAHVSAEDALE